ncbi:hypothetical protein QCA50_002328 [Cerrena zonata]|uniref:Uncharacterized protein n=1 Tax=Cerrena zonata TaxID=2478898 RepID=A0AAW0GP24_9APHY
MCNFIGNERWMEQLEHNHHTEFAKSKALPWLTLDGKTVAGEVRSAGGNGFSAGNVTFVQVYEAGHMVPFDQPEAAADLFSRWILDIPLTLNATEIADRMTVPFGGLV